MAWTRFTKKKDMPGGLWIKCESCGSMLFRKEFESRHRVCASCGYHFTLPGRERVELTADEGSFVELFADLVAEDRLGFVDKVPYAEKLTQTREKTGEADAMIVGTCTVHGIPCVLGVMNFAFLGGSMGMVVGEKVARAVETALERKIPVILVACSGGARMHEGAISLMQMAKTCATLAKLQAAGGFSISVMTHPTTGGVTASFASVCDLLIAEPGALIGFAGPRVIATTIKKELPKGFQRAEFLLEKGQIDRIVPRDQLRAELAKLMAYATGRDVVAAAQTPPKAEPSPSAPGKDAGKKKKGKRDKAEPGPGDGKRGADGAEA
ncbi:MAG: acetyl-CoA carboxylase carboxyltransferase subunit beta [Planctomycetes bacterium]|nr:acetyl-CoA carboxylase carboxyltransferase subunit beta [Planctomycetota bacterium]